MITIFTPTYNRADKLKILFDSLMIQTIDDFEWVIIDDGSTDNTLEVVSSFVNDKFKIKFLRKNNGGKHRAINLGVKLAEGNLFFIVDSDDFLVSNALERISFYFKKIRNKKEYAGVSGAKCYFSGKRVGNEIKILELECNALDFRYKYHVQGDMAEVFITDILKKYPFPEIPDEKFCPEALVWNRIAKNYKLLYFFENIYKCEYLDDGLSSNIVKIRMKSPIASMMYYSELEKSDVPLIQKIKANINFWRFSYNNNYLNYYYKIKMVNKLRSFIGFPLGFLLFLRDKL